MILQRIFDAPLAQAGFIVGDAETHEAIVIDPHRDVEVYLRAAEAEHLRIVAVTETHIHADFVSGTRELARRAGATAYLSDTGGAEWRYAWGDEPGVSRVREGDAIRAGRVRLDVLATPGHTPESVSFVLTDEAASPEPLGVFTGDFIFVGDVGRPDLLERAANRAGTMESGARALHGSITRFVARHAGHLLLWPGHGAGSACGKSLGGLPVTTLAYERATNWGLRTANEQEFVHTVLAGQPEPPTYFKHMKRMNQAGPPLLDGFREPPRLVDDLILAALERGDVVVDVRPSGEVVAGAIPGTLGIPVGRSFPTWAGWLLPYDRSVTLLAANAEQARAAVRQLAMIGLDHVTGWFGPEALAVWQRTKGAPVSTPSVAPREAFDRAARGELVLLDVRGAAEYAAGHVPGARHIPLGELPARADELPRDVPLALYCGGGTRSRIGVSVLRRAGFTRLVDQSGGFTGHAAAGLPVE